MSRRQYSPRTFLRQVPNSLLKEFFVRKNHLVELEWWRYEETSIEAIYEAWQKLPPNERKEIEGVFRAVDEMACEAGVKALVEEGPFHGQDLGTRLDKLEGLHHKAMWSYLNHPVIFQAASVFLSVESLPGRSWVRVTDLPRKEPDTSQAARDKLADSLSRYYREREGRGHRCTVESYPRGQDQHYFFAYPDDYADTYIGHDDDGHFCRRPQKRAFEVVFVYDPREGTLELFAKGGRDLREEVQRIFCTTILGENGTLGRQINAIYDLDGLLSRDFPFPTDPVDGIEEVRVRSLRLNFGPWRRLTLEANPQADREDLYDMLDEYLNDKTLRATDVKVTKATLQLRLRDRGKGKRQNAITFDVTYPESCTLKSLTEEQRLLGEKYLKRWKIDRA
jgi:hypothetical protein